MRACWSSLEFAVDRTPLICASLRPWLSGTTERVPEAGVRAGRSFSHPVATRVIVRTPNSVARIFALPPGMAAPEASAASANTQQEADHPPVPGEAGG